MKFGITFSTCLLSSLTGSLLLFSFASSANDSWACVEMSSQRTQDGILACGIGTAPTEQVAREEAFRRALNEFHLVCDSSSDCKGHMVEIDPKRTSCKREKLGFKCFRAVQFVIKDLEGTKLPFTEKESPSDAKIMARVRAVETRNQELLKKQQEQAAGHTIRKGMDVEDVIATLGNPYLHYVNIDNQDTLVYDSKSPFCIAGECKMYFHPKTGKLYKWENVSKFYVGN